MEAISEIVWLKNFILKKKKEFLNHNYYINIIAQPHKICIRIAEIPANLGRADKSDRFTGLFFKAECV